MSTAVETAAEEEEADASAVVHYRYMGVVDGMEAEDKKSIETEGQERALLVLEATGIMMHKSEPGGMTLYDAHNGFSNLIRLEILYMLSHHWPDWGQLDFNWYKHWAQLLLHQNRQQTAILIIREGVAQEQHLSMLLYQINLTSLAEDLQVVDPELLAELYASDATFDSLVR